MTTKLTHSEKLDRYLRRGKYALTREQRLNAKVCNACEGSGESTSPNRCGHCHGEGVIYPEKESA